MVDDSDRSFLDRPVFHRSGRTSPLGKLDDRIDAFRVSGVTKARLAVRAAQLGLPFTEFMQLLCDTAAHGPEEMKRLRCEHVDVVSEMLGLKDRER